MNKRWLSTILLGLALGIFPTAGSAQDKIRIAITPRSNVSTTEVGKGLDKHCPSVVIADDPSKVHYTLEAWDTGAGPGRKPYKFTLFRDGDRVFSSETRGVAGAVKNVCGYLQEHP
jgi:hypothetical protein